MNEKPVMLDMGFGEALARLLKAPKRAIDAVRKERQGAQKTLLAVELLKTTPRVKGDAPEN